MALNTQRMIALTDDTVNSRGRRKYDPEFKKEAVRLSEEPGKTVIEVAETLGIARELLYRWRREHRLNQGLAHAGTGWGALTARERKIRNLEQWILDAQSGRDV